MLTRTILQSVISFTDSLQDFLWKQYHERGESFEKEIDVLNETRQACRTPLRDETGVQLLIEYHNQLYFLERRFFTSGNSPNIFFEW